MGPILVKTRFANSLFLVLALTGAVVGAGCHTALHPPYVLAAYENVLWFTAEADAVASGPYAAVTDPTVPDPPGAARYQASDDLQEGLSHTVDRLSNAASPPAVVFELRGAMPFDAWLNVSSPVVGTLFVSNTVASTANQGIESGGFRIELWADGARVGGAQYELNAAASRSAGAGFIPIHFTFLPEQSAILAGAPVQIKVTPLNGLSDFVIGTSGTSQTFVELRYFRTNPIAGALYLEDRKLVASPDEPQDGLLARVESMKASGEWDALPEDGIVVLSGEDRNDAGLVAFVLGGATLVPFVGLLAIGGNRRGRRPGLAVAVALVFLAAGLSGCMGQGTTGTSKVNPFEYDGEGPAPVNTTVAENQTLLEQGVGAVHGVVQDVNGLRVAGANIAFLGTTLSQVSAKDGTFEFTDIPPASYTVRVDRTKYQSLEIPVDVEAGKRVFLNITLRIPDDVGLGDRAHLHDDWGDASRLLIQDVTFEPPTEGYLVAKRQTPMAQICENHGGAYSSADGSDSNVRCFYEIPIEVQQRVYPGAGHISIELTWTPGSNGPKELGLAYTNAAKTVNYRNKLVPRGPGDPFGIAFFPNEADPGHQKFTNWQFWVTVPTSDAYAPTAPAAYEMPIITAKIFIEKAVVPYEPAHPDRWAGATEMQVILNAVKSNAVIGGCLPHTDGWFAPDKGMFVPTGTGKITGTVLVKMTTGGTAVQPPLIQYGLSYKPANIPNMVWRENLKEATVTQTPTGFTFEIVPLPEEEDMPYQSASNWRFFFTDDQGGCLDGQSYGTSYRGGTQFTLSATAIKG